MLLCLGLHCSYILYILALEGKKEKVTSKRSASKFLINPEYLVVLHEIKSKLFFKLKQITKYIKIQ